MLTRSHLAVLRAALQFFDEELMPHDIGVMRPYFDEPLNEKPTASEIRELREFLRNCEVKYACVDPASNRITNSQLSNSAEEARLMTGDPAFRLAIVLMPSPG